MGFYDDLLLRKGGGAVFDKLVPISVEEIAGGSFNLSLPLDYINFLSEIGAGEFGDTQYMLYGTLVDPSEIYDHVPRELAGVLLFGDDFSGFNAGFRVRDWAVVEVDPSSKEVHEVAPSFEQFIREKILAMS